MKKRDIIGRFLLSALCGGALAIGNLFCVITAFDIPVDTDLLIVLCISASLLFSAAFIFKRGWIGVTLVVCLIMGLSVYNRSSVISGYILTTGSIAEQFIAAYDQLSQLAITATVPAGTMATSFLALVGAALALLTTSTVCRRYSLVPLAFVSLLLLSVCMLILDCVPDVWAFVLLLGVYTLLILTQSRRRKSTNGQYLLTLGLALPVMVFMLIIVNVVQPDTYVRSDRLLAVRDEFKAMFENNTLIKRDEVTGALEFVSPFVQDTLGVVSWNENISETDLSRIGPQIQTGASVMSVWSDDGGTIYLKGNSLGVYEDNRWLSLEDSDYTGTYIADGLWTTNVAARHEIMIRTDNRSSIFYLPYMPNMLPAGAEIYYDQYVANNDRLTEYTLAFVENSSSARLGDEYESFVHEVYTQVPEETKQALGGILDELSEYGSDVSGVVYYVRNSAAYSLDTERMPEGEEFVSWFLEDSDTGYCVHFATAATVLLRCMDIPARYVNGYMVDAKAGEWVTVTQDDAHAWVEFYIDGFGWQILEVTPASSETEAPETEAPIQPDVPEEPPSENIDSGSDATDRTPALSWIWILTAAVIIMILWQPMIRKLRSKLLKTGNANHRAIRYYHRILMLSKLSKKSVPEEAEELAMKARFSQHRLTNDELAVLVDKYRHLCAELQEDKKPHRYILYHFILALPKA